MGLSPRAGRQFEATARHMELNPLTVMELAVTPAEVLRTPRLIRRADPEMLSVLFPLDGGLLLAQSGRRTAVEQGQLALYDSSRPFEMTFASASGTATVVSAHAPRALLRLPLHRIDHALARPVPAGPGSGFAGLLAHLLTDLTGPAGIYPSTGLTRLGSIALDLLTAMLAQQIEVEGSVPEDTHHTTLLLRIEAFIQQHLHDASLTPTAIAAAHHISLGHLHRLFASLQTTTVAAWIRRQRLECARRDLSDLSLRKVPVHRIATRWGFTTHSSFTRAFHAAYGISPRDYRHRNTVASRSE
jgi:AraC-like DNA-binding protein